MKLRHEMMWPNIWRPNLMILRKTLLDFLKLVELAFVSGLKAGELGADDHMG